MYRQVYMRTGLTRRIVLGPAVSHNRVNAQLYRRLSQASLNNSRLLFSSSKPNNERQLFLYDSVTPALGSFAEFHSKSNAVFKDPDSNAEKAASLIKENIIQVKKEEKPVEAAAAGGEQKSVDSLGASTTSTAVDVQRATLWQRIVKELNHYYNGFKLLYFETKIAFRLLRSVLQGHTLTRRERRQFTRTAADLFRLVPFSVFIIVPFMEFTLPIFLKLFPNMLPSTFQEESKEQENIKKRLKAKLEMAKFLQDTLEETAMKADKAHASSPDSLSLKFSEFMKKVRSDGQQPSNDEIMKYSSLFENELTLDNLSRRQLIALCQILDVSTLANIPPNHILRFQLRMKIRTLEADDRMIIKEGIDALDIQELQQACRDRGMRAVGLSEARLRSQLQQWLELHINKKIPTSLLLLSRALYLPENLPAEDIIKSAISSLPKSIENATMAKIAEVSGTKLDNQVKLELLKQEEAEIKLEKDAASKEAQVPAAKATPVPKPVTAETLLGPEQLAKETLVDKARVLSDTSELLSPTEIKEINQIIENIPSSEKAQVKAEMAELKKDFIDYGKDVKEVEQLTSAENASKLTEAKSAKRLSKRVKKLIGDMDTLIAKLEKEPVNAELSQENKNTVSIEELLNTIKKIRGITNDEKEQKLVEVLTSLDKDHDGKIDDLNDVLKVFDLIEQENVKVSKDQMRKILTLLEKEKILEIDEMKLEEEQQQQQQQQKQNA